MEGTSFVHCILLYMSILASDSVLLVHNWIIMIHDWFFFLLSVLGLFVLWFDVAFVNQSTLLFQQTQPIQKGVVFEMNSDL